MSLVSAVIGGDLGIAISVDSAMAITLPAGSLLERQGFEDVEPGPTLAVPFADCDTKLAVLHGRFLVALAGAVPAATGGAALAGIAAHQAVVAATDPDAITGAVRRAVADLVAAYPVAHEGANAELGIAVVVGYRRDDGVPCLDVVDGSPTSKPLNWDPKHGQRCAGRFLLGQQQLVAPMLDALEGIETPVAHFPLPLAARFTRWSLQLALDVQEFTPGLRVVGGPILTAVLDADGARMVAPRRIEVSDYGLAAA